ncbi:GGDEF domain-containing protein [Deinococcus phoenicis]|nr:GGDEF domain-containing protein [Deinococcus phoenicis]
MRDPFLPFPDALPPADAWHGYRVFRRSPDRRETYQRVLPLALLGTLLPLALSPQATSGLLLTTLPLLAGLLGLVLALSLVQRCPPWLLDLLLLLGGWLLMLGQLALRLFMPGEGSDLALLGNVAPWFLALLLAPGWLLGGRRGRHLSGAALGSTLALTAAFALGPMEARGAEGHALLGALVQLLLVGGAMLLGQQAAARRTRTDARRAAWTDMTGQEFDPLTGLPGRRTLERVLTGHLRHRPAGLTVAVLRVDHLEQVTRDQGVAFAEALRAHVARTLTAAIRDEDVIGCLNDTTFAVLMRMPDPRFARAACERLRVRVASRPLNGILPTVSVGVAVWAGQAGSQALLEGAQQALGCARQDGGNRVHLSTEPPASLASAPAA